MHRIPPWLYFVMFLLVSYGVAREVWYRHWYTIGKKYPMQSPGVRW